MKYRFALVCVLLSGLGCASEGAKSQWDDFLKDVRGDNMQMLGPSFMDKRVPPAHPESAKSQD